MFIEKVGAPVGNHIFITGIDIIYIIMLRAGKLAGIFGRSL